MKQHSIWIDLTDLSVWTGHFTGIQRVVYQIGLRYEGQENVHYFTFNHKDNSFRYFDFSAIREQVEKSQTESETVGDDQVAAKKSISEQAKILVFNTYRRSPQILKDRLTPERKAKIRAFYKRKQHLIRIYKSPKALFTSGRKIVFHETDTLLIMGKPWDYPNLIEVLRQEKLKTKLKIVHLVHDMIPIFYPNLFGVELFAPYTRHLFEAIAISDGLITISESSQKDISRFCEQMLLPCPPIKTIREGDELFLARAIKPALDVEEGKFLLCVGTREVRKNHQLLYTAYKLGLSRGIKLPKLVIVGGRGWYADDAFYQLTHDPELWGVIYVVSDMHDSSLRWLYENCMFTVFPSVYEGWGLPIAESLAYGKLCISSNTSSMPEIAGDLIEYFSPYNSEEFLDAIVKYLDPAVLKHKEEEIKSRYKLTNWDDTFAEVKDFVSKIAKS